MKAFRLLAALLCALLLCAPVSAGGVSAGYYHGSGAAGRDYTAAAIPAELLTHVNYAFAQINPETGRIFLPDTERDLTNLSGLRELREANPALKLVIAVGGWDGSLYFSDAAATPQSREAFAQSCLDLVLEHDLDGADLDWEYPVSGGPSGMTHRPEDKQNFTLLLRAIRDKFDEQEAKNGRDYCLTIAGADGASYLKKIEPEAVAEITDHIFLMAYDYSGSWSEKTGFNAPLNRVRQSVEAYIKAGVPADKLVLGIPLYGRRFQGAGPGNHGLYVPYEKTSSVTYDAVVREYLTDPDYSLHRDAAAAAPYLYGAGAATFITYEDPESTAAKAALAKEMGLAGIGFWEVSQDRNGVLIESARDTFNGASGGMFTDVVPGSWYADAAEQAARSGWMTGTSAGVFSPGTPLTRGMFAAILHRVEGAPSVSGSPFSDVSPEHYSAAAAAWAAQAGIVTGFADGAFHPNASITREQLAAMLYRYAQYKGYDTGAADTLGGYQDASRIQPYAREAMAWAVDAGLLQGRSGGMLVPGGTASRAETAVILTRFAEKFGGSNGETHSDY